MSQVADSPIHSKDSPPGHSDQGTPSVVSGPFYSPNGGKTRGRWLFEGDFAAVSRPRARAMLFGATFSVTALRALDLGETEDVAKVYSGPGPAPRDDPNIS